MAPSSSTVARVRQSLGRALPEGRLLPEPVWRRRHRSIVRLAVVQALAIGVLGLALGQHPLLAAAEVVLVASPLLLAVGDARSRKLRAFGASVSLFAASVAAVHLASGMTESHFHFFVMVGVVALYQDWVPFGVGLAIVLLHHTVIGSLRPDEVYGTHAAVHQPFVWALVHGGFVLAASLAHLAAWRLNEQQGLVDPLTGLANRTLLRESLTRLLRREEPVSVLFIDLDDFKEVNDSLGHATGDHLLRTVADRLQGCVRAEDVVARLGGDEFAVAVRGDADAARAVGRRVLRALADPAHVEGRQLTVTASVGCADMATARRDDGVPCEDILLRNADLAMYLAKAAGKNQIVVYADGMDQAAREKAELTAELAHALDDGQLEVYYQPTVTLDDGRAFGYEALLRWHNPTRGPVPPDVFIPLAEDSGQILPIGAWVLRTAVAQAAQWAEQTGDPVHIAVNLSPRQLADDAVVTVVGDALAASGLPAARLTLEITEGVLVRDVDAVSDRLVRLRTLGVRIAIDDFGTGYSSLSYLRRLPVDSVKIDRSFVQDLTAGGTSATLVSSIIELARSLHLDVVAEGVETEQQADILRRLRCVHGQGYLYARPMPASALRTSAVVAG